MKGYRLSIRHRTARGQASVGWAWAYCLLDETEARIVEGASRTLVDVGQLGGHKLTKLSGASRGWRDGVAVFRELADWAGAERAAVETALAAQRRAA